MAFLLSAPLAADSFVFPFSGKSATVSTLSNGSTGSSRHILRSKNTDNSNANEKITVGNTNNESLFDEIYTLTNAFEGIQLQKAALKKEIAAYTAQRTALQDTVDFQNNVVLNTIDQEISRLSAALNNVNGSEKEGAKKKKEKKEKATAESFANLQKQLEDKIALAQEQIDVLTKQIDSKDREIQEYATFETKLKSDYSTLKKELKEAEAALGSRDKVISSLEKDNEQQSEEVKALSESLVSALADSEMEVEKIKSAWEKERSELEGVKER
jgi:chromosome segregation ATPase